MTPTALTPAGRGTTDKRSSRTTGHRGTVRKQSTTRKPPLPRRVSGPKGGIVRPQRAPAPARTHVPRTARRTASPAVHGSLPRRAAAFVVALPDHALLDRIVRGRAWIPILGVLLAGIVAMQVEVLKLSASMGRSIERGTALQSRNEQLRASVAQLSDDQRIERLAAAMGLVMPQPSAVDFLGTHPAQDLRRALANIHPPDASGFVAALPAIDTPAGAAAAASSAGVTPAPGSTVTPATTTATGTSVTSTPSTSTPVGATGTTVATNGGTGATVAPNGGTGATVAPVGPTQQTGPTGAAASSGG